MPLLYFSDIDCRETVFQDRLYLLRSDGTILGARNADGHPVAGENLFAALSANASDLDELFRSRGCFRDASFLLCCRRENVLILRCLYAQTNLLCAVRPLGEVGERLAYPAVLYRSLEHLDFSRQSLKRARPIDGAGYNAVNEWLRALHAPFFTPETDARYAHGTDLTLAAIEQRIRGLVRLCGCRLQYDFSGLTPRALKTVDLDILSGFLFPVLLAVYRAAETQSAELQIDREAPIDAVLTVRCTLTVPDDPLPELSTLTQEAELRGLLFESYAAPHDPARHLIRFSICPAELSLQGVKHPTIYRTQPCPLPEPIPASPEATRTPEEPDDRIERKPKN